MQCKQWVKKLFRDDHDFLKSYLKTMLPNFYYRQCIRKKMKNNSHILQYQLNERLLRDIKDFWNNKLGLQIYTEWHQAYIATNGIEDYKYVPEDIFYKIIEPRLNRLSLKQAYEDKNNYNKVFTHITTPITILRNINGFFYDGEYKLLTFQEAINKFREVYNNKLVIKPTLNSGGGRNIKVICKDDFVESNFASYFEQLVKIYKKDFIVQGYVVQHNFLGEVHPNSLNTLRIISLRFNNKIYILSSILRMGNSGNIVDNATVGGLTCGINKEGKLNDFATEHYTYFKHRKHPFTDFVFADKYIPNHKVVEECVEELHSQLLYFDIASWDIAISKNGEPIFIEVNLGNQDINFHQRNNGPLFGSLTEQVINYAKSLKR